MTPDRSDLGMAFRTAAQSFKLIDDSIQTSVLVPYGEGGKWIDQLEDFGPNRRLLRNLQRYSVNIYSHEFDAMQKRGSVKEISPGIHALICEVEYDPVTGLKTDEEHFDPEKYNI